MAVLIGLALMVTVAQTSDGITDEVVQVVQAADEAGVPVDKLMGAMHTMHQGPREYLMGVGELDPPDPPAPAVAIRPVWDRLAGCESSGDWHSASNPKYKGGVQMDATFWSRYGGLAFASRPDYASREQQVIVAERGLDAQGWCAWPTCAVRLGLVRRCP